MAKLRVIELFAGIGAQASALDRIGADWESVGIVEIDPYCVTSYNAIHGTDYKPLDITQVESLPDCDMLTYSFPCQDISTAGRQRGFNRDSGTRSSLLYEVERLLNDYDGRDALPKFLIMENVKNLVGKRFKADFDKWVEFLASLGYKTYWQVLNASDYGVPQNRERVIAVSILSNELFKFPPKRELKTKLKDMLEEQVDEKYYITDAQLTAKITSTYRSRKESVIDTRGGGALQNDKGTRLQRTDLCHAIRVGGRGSVDNKHSWDLISEVVENDRRNNG